MDENNRNDKIDLTEFDLSQFSEYFAEEDAKREAEQKAEAERLEREEAERAEKARIQREAELRKKQEAERLRLEQEAAEKAARNAEREKEEAKRAAARAAEAALAAKKAQEAKESANIAAAEELSDDSAAESAEPEKTADFAEISSVLDFEEIEPNKEEVPEYLKNDIEENKKGRSGIFTAIVIILALAAAVCLGYSAVKYSNVVKPADTAQDQAVDVEYKPYADLETVYNDVSYPNGINESLKPMYSQNTDLAGWVTIDGMNIDYPVMQDKNNTYYLNNKNAFDESARYGTPFLDFRCLKAGLSKNTVIYGHHMVNGEHFGSLDNYVNPEFYKEHPIIEYETLTGSYKFKIYAVFYATTEGSSDGGYIFEYYNPKMSDSSFEGYIKMVDQYALYTTEAGLRSTDRIITLSTCSHVYDSLKSGGVDTRLVVVGRLLRSGEDESVNTANVTVNSNYRRPQIWYDKNNATNPYSSYRSWSPN